MLVVDPVLVQGLGGKECLAVTMTGRCLVVSKTGIVHELWLWCAGVVLSKPGGAGRAESSELLVVGGLLMLYNCSMKGMGWDIRSVSPKRNKNRYKEREGERRSRVHDLTMGEGNEGQEGEPWGGYVNPTPTSTTGQR